MFEFHHLSQQLLEYQQYWFAGQHCAVHVVVYWWDEKTYKDGAKGMSFI